MSITQLTPRNAARHAESGNAAIIILVLLIGVAIGVLSFMAGKRSADIAPKTQIASTQPAGTQDEQTASAQPDDSPTLATVDGSKITRNEVFALLQNMPQQMQQMPSEQLLPMAIEQEINNKIIDNKAANANLTNDTQVLQQMANVKQQLIRAKFLENEVNKKMTEDRVKAAYEDYVKNFPKTEEVKAAHILVDSEAKAKEIIAKLEKGADFAELAKENSKDGTAKNGGDLGYFAKADVVPEFAEAAFSTEKGTYTKKPVKSNFGYHIIKVEDKRIRPPADFATAKPYLEQELRRKILDEIVMDWRNKAQIERFDINGNPLKPEDQAAAQSESAPAQEPAAGAETAPTETPAPAAEEAPAEKPAE
ncbi:MAG: peptidylprolyl isomerase [Alphaproteobacteria bacterium]|nr:peptidylprolyl isomerase [Alphaproteobacteria bacterium]